IATPIPFTDIASSFSVTLQFEMIDKDRKQKARFRYVGTGGSIGVGSVVPGAVAPVIVTQGSKVDFQTSKGASLGNFVGDAEVIQQPGAGVSVLSTGGDFNFDFTEMQKTFGTQVKAKGGTVDVNAGQAFSTLPSAGLGGITTGKIVMVGGV